MKSVKTKPEYQFQKKSETLRKKIFLEVYLPVWNRNRMNLIN